MDYRYFQYNCMFVTFLFLGTIVGAVITGFEMPRFETFKFLYVVCFVTTAFAWFYTYVRKNENIAHTALGMFSFGLFLKPALMFSYVALRIGGEKVDDELLAFDNAIGFDWTVIGPWAAESPEFMSWMALAYSSSLHMSVLSIFMIGMMFQRPKQVHQFFTAILVSGLICGLCGGFFPIDGIYREGVIPEDVMLRINPIMDLSVTDQINELRYGDELTLNITGGLGVVGIPSFHTILSALLVWMARGTGWFFIVSLIWNGAIIFSTPLMGNHYVADVVGGLVTTAFAIWATHQLYKVIDAHYARTRTPNRLFGMPLPKLPVLKRAG